MSDFFDSDGRRPGEPGRRMLRRDERRRRLRRRRLTVLVVVVLALAAIAALAVWRPWDGGAAATSRGGGSGAPVAVDSPGTTDGAAGDAPSSSPSPSRSSHPSTAQDDTDGATTVSSPSPSPSAEGVVSPSPAATPSPSRLASPPRIVQDLIPYGSARKAEMADYSRRHYGQDTWVLKPSAIVLHYTASSSYAAAHAAFASNARNLGELPGVASHFVIGKDGTIYQQVPLNVRTRHTIGLNYCAVGIEFVQQSGSSPTWAIDQIFARRRQLDAGLRLVAWLQAAYGIDTKNVLGHAMANSSPLFKDLLGWKNTHQDWNAAATARFKQALVGAE